MIIIIAIMIIKCFKLFLIILIILQSLIKNYDNNTTIKILITENYIYFFKV